MEFRLDFSFFAVIIVDILFDYLGRASHTVVFILRAAFWGLSGKIG